MPPIAVCQMQMYELTLRNRGQAPSHIWIFSVAGARGNRLRAVALLEFLRAAAWARIVAANVLQGVAYRFLVSVAAIRAVDMAVVVIMVIVIVVAVRTMDMGLLSHWCRSGIKSPGIISSLRITCTSLPMNNPVFNSPSRR